MRLVALFTLLALAAPAAPAAAQSAASADDRATMKTLIALRGAPCGDITDVARVTAGIIARCSNGQLYAGVQTADGKGWVLGKKNELTHGWDPY